MKRKCIAEYLVYKEKFWLHISQAYKIQSQFINYSITNVKFTILAVYIPLPYSIFFALLKNAIRDESYALKSIEPTFECTNFSSDSYNKKKRDTLYSEFFFSLCICIPVFTKTSYLKIHIKPFITGYYLILSQSDDINAKKNEGYNDHSDSI